MSGVSGNQNVSQHSGIKLSCMRSHDNYGINCPLKCISVGRHLFGTGPISRVDRYGDGRGAMGRPNAKRSEPAPVDIQCALTDSGHATDLPWAELER